MSRKVYRRGRRIVLELTFNQARALRELATFANHDRDCEQYHRETDGTPAEIRAMRDCMALTLEASRLTR